jgi:uncharacterized YccA/Bax inhibitor family protein
MQSNNPVFRRSEAFNGQANAYGNQTYAGNGSPYAGYGDPATWGTGTPTGTPGSPTHLPTSTRRMTIDSVVQSSAISLLLVMASAIAVWVLTPEITQDMAPADLSGIFAAVTVGGLAAFGLSLVNSFKRIVSPGLVLAFAVAEGVALGGLSKLFDAQFGDHIVINAVMGTFAAFAGTLAAYKYFDIKVGAKFRMFVIAGMFGLVGLSVLELVLSMFGAGTGLFGVTGLGMITAVAGLALGIFMLILDFDMVEQGVAAGVDERESWRAAFALTVSLVWIYTNLLRILAFFNDN